MSSYEYFKIFKNTYFQEYVRTAVSVLLNILIFFFFEKWKNGKSETRKSRKSGKSRKHYSEFSIWSYSQNRKLGFEILGKKFPRFPRFPGFPSFRPGPWRHYEAMRLPGNSASIFPEAVSQKIGILKNFTKLKGKHLCQSLFSNKVAVLKPNILL